MWEDRGRGDASVSWCELSGRLSGLSVSLSAEWDNATCLTEFLQRLNYGLPTKSSERHLTHRKAICHHQWPLPRKSMDLF